MKMFCQGYVLYAALVEVSDIELTVCRKAVLKQSMHYLLFINAVQFSCVYYPKLLSTVVVKYQTFLVNSYLYLVYSLMSL